MQASPPSGEIATRLPKPAAGGGCEQLTRRLWACGRLWKPGCSRASILTAPSTKLPELGLYRFAPRDLHSRSDLQALISLTYQSTTLNNLSKDDRQRPVARAGQRRLHGEPAFRRSYAMRTRPLPRKWRQICGWHMSARCEHRLSRSTVTARVLSACHTVSDASGADRYPFPRCRSATSRTPSAVPSATTRCRSVGPPPRRCCPVDSSRSHPTVLTRTYRVTRKHVPV